MDGGDCGRLVMTCGRPVILVRERPSYNDRMTQTIDCPPAGVLTPLQQLKTRQQATWASGDFAVIGTTLDIVGEDLCEAADLRSGMAVLDVACGNGNATLAAARRYCDVTGIDYVPALLERGDERARAERLAVRYIEADAEQLPFAKNNFDAVLSTFGVMFTADHTQAAREMVRVVKPGGTIALASWTAEGFIGALLRLVSKHVPPPPAAQSPLRWGNETELAQMFGDTVTITRAARKMFNFRYHSPAHFIEIFRDYYGPTHKAFGALDDQRRMALSEDLVELIAKHDRGGGRGLVVPAEYLEIVLEKRPASLS
jgi:ubiquinone/menaquinone biosynthesis C-methylase UbiE